MVKMDGVEFEQGWGKIRNQIRSLNKNYKKYHSSIKCYSPWKVCLVEDFKYVWGQEKKK